MSMFEAKSMIIATVIQQDKPFKAAKIFQKTNLSRSLVRYHLDQLLSQGYLEKNGMFYVMVNKEGLINSLISYSEEERGMHLAKETYYLNVSKLNSHAKLIAIMRYLQLPFAQEIKATINEEINATIRQLKEVRKYVNEKTFNSNKAALKAYTDLDIDPVAVFGTPLFKLNAEISSENFTSAWQERMDKVDND